MGLLEQNLGIQKKVQFLVNSQNVPQSNGGLFNQINQFSFGQSANVVISIDASVSETHKRESPPTRFEVEDGTTVSDHIIVRPFELTINGIISDTPITLFNQLVSTVQSAVLPPFGIVGASAASALGSVIGKVKKPSVAAYLQLLQLQQQRTSVNVLTTLNLYQNMFINSLSVPREASTSNALVFTVSLSQLILVSPQSVNLAKFKDPANGAGKQNAGNKQNKFYAATQAGVTQGVTDIKNFVNGVVP